MKYEALEISEVGTLWKKSAYTLQLIWTHLKARCLHIATAVGGQARRQDLAAGGAKTRWRG